MHSFKSLAYEPSSDEFETKFEEAIEEYDDHSDDEDDDNFVGPYPQFVAYFKNVCELKTSWALCYRSTLMLRGHNTNNTAEAQFLVMKDKILQRIKEYNAVALFEKLAIDLSDHYMDKLLSVSSGSYDSFTSRRFDGKTKKKGEIGFKVPSPENQQWIAAGCSDVGLHRVRVPSETTPGKFYIVDMFLGTCECEVGSSGAPCKHQFILWATMKKSSPNFMPFFNKEQRMHFARIAIGDEALRHPELFEPLRKVEENVSITFDEDISIQTLPFFDTQPADEIQSNIGTSEIQVQSIHNTSIEIERKDTAMNDLEESFDIIRKMVASSDKNFTDGISKFKQRLNSLSQNQVASAFHKFGTNQFLRKQMNARIASKSALKIAQKACKRAQQNQIGVQPASQSRRKKKNGSRKSVPKGRSASSLTSSDLPVPIENRKREHVLAKNIEDNVPSAKKHSKDMKSRSRPVVKKKANVDKKKLEK